MNTNVKERNKKRNISQEYIAPFGVITVNTNKNLFPLSRFTFKLENYVKAKS